MTGVFASSKASKITYPFQPDDYSKSPELIPSKKLEMEGLTQHDQPLRQKSSQQDSKEMPQRHIPY